MIASATEATVLGNGLSVTRTQDGARLSLVIALKTAADCVLHWGLSRGRGGAWQQPPQECWPQGTSAFDNHAVDTPLQRNAQGEREVSIHLELPCRWDNLVFVVHFPREKRWLNSGGKDFVVPLPKSASSALAPGEALTAWVPNAGPTRQVVALDGGGELAMAAWEAAEAMHVCLVCNASPTLLLHWGLAWQFRNEWRLPPEDFRSPATSLFDQQAARPSSQREGLLVLELHFPRTRRVKTRSVCGLPFMIRRLPFG